LVLRNNPENTRKIPLAQPALRPATAAEFINNLFVAQLKPAVSHYNNHLQFRRKQRRRVVFGGVY